MSFLGSEVNFVSSEFAGFEEKNPNQLSHLARGKMFPPMSRPTGLCLSSGVLTANTLDGGDGGRITILK